MLLLKFLMGLSAAASAAQWVYSGLLLYEYFGLSKEMVGMLQSINPIISLIALPAAMYIAETYFDMKKMLIVCTTLGAITYGTTVFIEPHQKHTELLLLLVTIISSLTLSSVGSFIDSITLICLGPDNQQEYGKQRLWASICWGIGSFLAGFLMDKTRNDLWIIYVYLIFISMFLISALFIQLPEKPSVEEAEPLLDPSPIGQSNESSLETINSFPDPTPSTPTFFSALFHIHVVLFFLTFALIGMTFAVIGSYLFIYFSTTWRASPTLLGLTTPFSILWELPVFYYSDRFLKKMGIVSMIVIALLLQALRLLLYIILPVLMDPILDMGGNYVIILLETLHGAAFALSWAAGMEHLQHIAPAKYKSAWIGLYCTIYNNLGGICGNLMGGWLYDAFGYQYLWGSCLALTLLSLIMYIVSVIEYRKVTKDDSTEG